MPHKKLFQPHRHKGRFFNHSNEKHQSKILPSLIMLFEVYWNTLKKGSFDRSSWFAPDVPVERSEELQITWIGHSTFLIQLSGLNILTDPIFGHLPFFRRQIKSGIPLKKIPPIDYVIISHNHHDHMDAKALNFLKHHPGCTFLVPLGDKKWFMHRGFTRVREYTWWEKDLFSDSSLEFSFLPAHHWSQRGLTDFNKSLWGSWMIQCKDHSIYFAGDTAYSGHFSAIAQEFPSITHALMPIGPCEPRKWMKHTHINAEEAVQAFLDLKAKKLFPMHWGTFSFGTDYYESPFERLLTCWHKQKMSTDKELVVLKVGQRTGESHTEATSELPIPKSTQQLQP